MTEPLKSAEQLRDLAKEQREEDEYVLAGYFRFVESDKPGVIGEIRSTYKPYYADDSDIPFYRKKKTETKRSLDGSPLQALPVRGR